MLATPDRARKTSARLTFVAICVTPTDTAPSVIAPTNGFASNRHQELLLRATPGCRHGIRG